MASIPAPASARLPGPLSWWHNPKTRRRVIAVAVLVAAYGLGLTYGAWTRGAPAKIAPATRAPIPRTPAATARTRTSRTQPPTGGSARRPGPERPPGDPPG